MLIISRVFAILSLLCLCGNKEYPGGFQNKWLSSSFNWVSNYILFLAKLKGKGRTSIDFFLNLSSTCRDNVNYYKIVHHPIPTLPVGIGNTLAIFKLNQKAFLSNECLSIFSSWPNWIGDEGISWWVPERGSHCEITIKSIWLSRKMKTSFLL